MSSTPAPSETPTGTARASTSDLKLEVVIIPVSDVDRAKEFYAGLGWRLDADFPFDNGFRSSSSRRPARGARSSSARISRPPRPVRPRASSWSSPTSRPPATSSSPAASRSARSSIRGAGRAVPARRRAVASAGGAPDQRQLLLLRHLHATRTATAGCCRRSRRRLPGRIDAAETRSRPGGPDGRVAACGDRPRRAREAHRRVRRDWPDWYAAYMVAEQAGTELPT